MQSCIEEQEAVSERIAVYDQYIESLSDAAQAYEGGFSNAQQTDDNLISIRYRAQRESIREGIEEMRTEQTITGSGQFNLWRRQHAGIPAECPRRGVSVENSKKSQRCSDADFLSLFNTRPAG